ncbi:hypothetical protein [Nonomuraea dietziae]|uniref:hypothetical protein n=1 Tax=Nonomuraea dietziae TaxID=65515 RepID=UPI0031CFF088
MNNWFTSAGWDYNGTVRAIPAQYGVQMFDANWWRVIENIAANHAKHRNNVIFADFQALLIPDTTGGRGGDYTFGLGHLRQVRPDLRRRGAMQYIYTPHLLEGLPKRRRQARHDQEVNGVVQAGPGRPRHRRDQRLPRPALPRAQGPPGRQGVDRPVLHERAGRAVHRQPGQPPPSGSTPRTASTSRTR